MGCSLKNNLTIEDHEWKFSIAQNSENGQVVYCTDNNQELYEDAEVLDIWCKMDDGIMLISNNDTQETWSLNYSLSNKASESYNYEVKYSADEEKTGLATVGITKKQNENDEYTLIVSIDGYALHFIEEISE